MAMTFNNTHSKGDEIASIIKHTLGQLGDPVKDVHTCMEQIHSRMVTELRISILFCTPDGKEQRLNQVINAGIFEDHRGQTMRFIGDICEQLTNKLWDELAKYADTCPPVPDPPVGTQAWEDQFLNKW